MFVPRLFENRHAYESEKRESEHHEGDDSLCGSENHSQSLVGLGGVSEPVGNWLSREAVFGSKLKRELESPGGARDRG